MPHSLANYASSRGEGGSWTANFLDWLCTEVERDARFCSPIMGGVSN